MRFEQSAEVAAPARLVFDTYADLERWSSWTGSVMSIERLDRGPLRVGCRARVRQPRLPVAVWQVIDLVPGESFTWVTRRRGVVTTGTHRVEPTGAASSRVSAVLEQAGPLGPLVGLLSARLTRRYLRTEVEGIKAYCES